jgi:hypothetical protein
MFFRREAPKNPSFQERLQNLRSTGFTVTPLSGGEVKVTRGEAGIILREQNGEVSRAARAGVVMGEEIGSLVDGGYQKFFRTPSGRQRPAMAEDLKAIHEFEEDLKEAFGLVSLYNESLGSVSTYYLYDRVQDRDRGVPKRAWE